MELKGTFLWWRSSNCERVLEIMNDINREDRNTISLASARYRFLSSFNYLMLFWFAIEEFPKKSRRNNLFSSIKQKLDEWMGERVREKGKWVSERSKSLMKPFKEDNLHVSILRRENHTWIEFYHRSSYCSQVFSIN